MIAYRGGIETTMNLSIEQERKIKRRRLFGLVAIAALALVILAGICIHKHKTSQFSTSLWKGVPPPTWDGVPAALDAAVHSAQYKDGGKYLSNPSMIETASDARRIVCAYRIVIDFLRSLTPEQVNILRRQPLAFSQLKRDQQNTLLRLADVLHNKEALVRNPSETGIFVCDFSTVVKDGKPTFLFNWIRSPHPGKLCEGAFLSFPPNRMLSRNGTGIYIQ